MTEQWRNSDDPPRHSRNILLRFDLTGERDCVGFYDIPYQEYCTWQDRGRVGGFVNPLKWREMDSPAKGGAS